MRPYSWGLYAQPVLLGQRPAQSEYTVPLRQCTWWYTLVGEKVIDSRPSDILSAIVRREEERILASLLGERRWGLLELVRAIDHYFLYILGLDEKDREEEVKSDRWDLCRKTGGTAKTSVEMSCPEELAFREGRLEKIREAMAALEAEAQAAAEQAVRQGITADRSGFAKRLWRLRDGPMPGALLVLMADAVRLRHARRLLSTTEASITGSSLLRWPRFGGISPPNWPLTSHSLGRLARLLSSGGIPPLKRCPTLRRRVAVRSRTTASPGS